MNRAEKKKYLEDSIVAKKKDNMSFRINIKYYKKIVLPELAIENKKKKIGKYELDTEKKKIKDWEKAIEMNLKFINLLKEEISHLN